MSESEVSHIQDEDVLRRMWQATEDFGRKKEIRAHMYRLREERLRSLYSPEPPHSGKGCEWSGAGHGQSFADQSFQSMKSKEVRDAGSPPKEFSYRGQDLKALSNAGWNVESEDRSTDDGRTHVKHVNASIEGQYDVEGGRGRFAAVDQQRRAVTEHQDANSHSRRDESASNTAAHEHVVRHTEDGARLSSTTSSSSTSTQVRQVSSSTHEATPLDRLDRRAVDDVERTDRATRTSNTDSYERSPRATDVPLAELVSRKVEYPDDNTKVIVETRVMPDGTRVTSTRREFCAPAHSTRAEHHSRTESYSSHRSDHRDSATTRRSTDRRTHDIVDSQRNVDDHDFKKQLREYSSNERENVTDTQQCYDVKTNKKVIDHTQTSDEYTQKRYETRVDSKTIDQLTKNTSDAHTQRHTVDQRNENRNDETGRHHTTRTQDHDFHRQIVKETRQVHDSEENSRNVFRETKDSEEITRHVTSDKTAVQNEIRTIAEDVLTDFSEKINNTPKYDTNTEEKNIQKTVPDRMTPKEQPQNEPQNERAPQKYRDSPAPHDGSPDIPSDRVTTENSQHINRDTMVERAVERHISNEQYQTTYQNDYQSRKVSTDWSPTHQAWASTLRADTPSTTRPSTRASSPGSKTFKSSNSSLRSSVSPDKTRKPSSRGCSPSKVDRMSPTRTITSDRYSSTHSTQTITEKKVNKTTSPERKPPSGHSPSRPGYSPERKPQDGYRQRSSLSPEKNPKSFSNEPNVSPKRQTTEETFRNTSPTRRNEIPKSSKGSHSPDRRPAKQSDDKVPSPHRSTSPDSKPVNRYLNRSSPRTSPSPERKPSHKAPADSPASSKSGNTTLQKSSPSPDRNIGLNRSSTPDISRKRTSVSPDRKPNYMKPTVSSQPVDIIQKPGEDKPNRKSPTKQILHSPDRKPEDVNNTSRYIDDHFKFVDEEKKTYTRTDVTNTSKTDETYIQEKLPSNDLLDYQYPDSHKVQQREPSNEGKSPIKDKTVTTENDELYGKSKQTVESITITAQLDKKSDDISVKRISNNKETIEDQTFGGPEKTPSKYDTYEKKKPRIENNTVVTTLTTEKTDKYNSMTRREMSPKKIPATPSSPTRKTPRDSLSPAKSPTKDTKYKHTTDCISTEKNIEETNKKTTVKERPRQLITPSTSPTRKPKPTEPESSTGQSSPTTSVSGFVYFGSPRAERPLVTDLDEFYPGSENPEETSKRPETLEVKRSPSPSKIPCRSPSPEKHVQSPKDSLPRKSSLKKPTADFVQGSPAEKPPTSFRVSPTNDLLDIHDHKAVKKDQPSEPETGELVTSEPKYKKPPLQRRETYDDRCKKILGLVDNTTTETITKETRKYTKKSDDQTKPSVSPCDSPAPNEPTLFSNFSTKETPHLDSDVTDFITHEKDDLMKNKTIYQQKNKVPSRDSSPTKMNKITTTATDERTKEEEEYFIKQTVKTKQPNKSPEKDLPHKSPSSRPSESPERKRAPSTEKCDVNSSQKPTGRYSKNTSPSRKSPEKTCQYNATATTVTTLNTSSIPSENVKEIKKSTTVSQPSRTSKSPTRESPKTPKDLPEHTGDPHGSSPTKYQPIDRSPVKKSSPEKSPVTHYPKESNELHLPDDDSTRSRDSPEKTPGYMKSTKTITAYIDRQTTEDTETINVSSITVDKKERKSSSPIRKIPYSSSPSKISSDLPENERDKSPKRQPASSIPTNDNQVPGYMKATKTAISKVDEKSTTTDVHETTRSTTEKTHVASVSPTRKPKSTSERSPSPSKPSRPSDISIDKKPGKSQPASPSKSSTTKKTEVQHPSTPSPLQPSSDNIPGYMKPTASMTIKQDIIEYDRTTTENTQEMSSTIKDKKYFRDTVSPSHDIPRTTSPSRPSSIYDVPRRQDSPISETNSPTKLSDKLPRGVSPTKDAQTPNYMKKTTAISTKFDTILSSTEDTKKNTTSGNEKRPSESVSKKTTDEDRLRSVSPSKGTKIPDSKPSLKSPLKENPLSEHQNPKQTQKRPSSSPEKPNYMNLTESIKSKFDTTTTQETLVTQSTHVVEPKMLTRQSPRHEPNDISSHLTRPEESRQLRTPSPTKKTIISEVNNDFIISEREQEILNKVQKSLRKLSPERKEKSPSRDRSPTKSTTSLQDLDIISSESTNIEQTTVDLCEIVEEPPTTKSKVPRPTQLKDYKVEGEKTTSKPSSRNVSPQKRTLSTPGPIKTPESPTKSRSFSPKKPVSYAERPQSPQQPRVSGIKHTPSILTRKPTPATLSTSRVERIATEAKKTNNVTKTTSRSIPSPTGKLAEPDNKRVPTSKSVKDNVITKKGTVTRTSSEVAMKPKKTSSPQRVKSKPEIQVNDVSTKSPKYQKLTKKEPHSKLPTKPKSATSLNTSLDEDDIIIDVQQSKSSRENSPDRICPTPINFADDVGIPRFPDEVSEPDDELVKRRHHTIHETESVVDDIVEICEDEELFVKKSEMEVLTEQDDSLLSVNDKVSKFTNKIHSVNKPKDTLVRTFNETEKRVHSDFIEENLKSDECLLTVSEKVNKFAKGPRDTKDNRSPSRNISEEYDRDTVYTDDYTKLSVNDKAHLFVETAENIKTIKVKPVQKFDRPDLSNVDESLKSDDCLLSVSDKVNKFVKTAEQYIAESQDIEQNETRNKEQNEKNMKHIYNEDDVETNHTEETVTIKETAILRNKPIEDYDEVSPRNKESKPTVSKSKDYSSPSKKLTDRVPSVKITTLRSSEAVKKAKALFENIASSQKETSKSTKLTDIGVLKKYPKSDSTKVLHPAESTSPQLPEVEDETEFVSQTEKPTSGTAGKPQFAHIDEKPRSSPVRLTAQSPEVTRSKSPIRHGVEVTTTKTVLSRYPAATRAESPRQRPESPRPRTESPRQRHEADKPDKVPGYLRPTKTSQIKEDTKVLEEAEVSSRRGSGKFGVELRRTSVERSTVSSERRRSVEHHQPCIEDIFDLDLLEQMLEKVSGYEQRRRIRAQIRVVKNQSDNVEINSHTKVTKHLTTVSKTRSPERKVTKSPERTAKITQQRTISPERANNKSTTQKTIPDRAPPKEATVNGHAKEPSKIQTTPRQRPQSPEKPVNKSTLAPKTPVRQPSPDKKTRPSSPSKAVSKPKGNRFNEYASKMKKVGLNDSETNKITDTKTKKTTGTKQTVKHETQQRTEQEFTTTKSFSERTSSKDVIEIIQSNGKRSPSPKQRQSPERKVQFPEQKTLAPERKASSPERRPYTPEHKAGSPDRKAYSPTQKAQSPDRLHQRTPTPDFKRTKPETGKETIIKTVYDIEKKIPSKPVQEEKPSWVTNRNLKKITSESRTFSSKKIESEKTKYRAPSPSKVIAKPTDVITSSYGPGPLDADGKPLFGIKALRNGATNFQVKGTVIRQEFHSRNGSAPEGSVSVTAYSSQPEELERLLAAGGAPASRLHGLAAITTTRRFGPDTGATIHSAHTKEERASLEQFTHHDRRVEHLESAACHLHELADTRLEEITDRHSSQPDHTSRREDISEVKRQKVEERRERMEKREDKKTVRQSSVKSLTEKYIKSANEGGKPERSAYPKAGLILRTTAMRDSVSSDDAPSAGLQRADSEHSVCSAQEVRVSSSQRTSTRTDTTRPARQPGAGSPPARQPGAGTATSRRTLHTETVESRSFLDSSTKVTGVQDILTRMKNADIVVQEGDRCEDSEARALLNKFLGATVLMAGMQGYVADTTPPRLAAHQEAAGGGAASRGLTVREVDLDQCWDEQLLNKLLEECTDYEQRRLLRARIRTLMAEQEACASAVSEALGAGAAGSGGEEREEEEVTVTSSVRRDSSDKTVSSTTTTRTCKVTEMSRPAPKPVSPFAKFRQLEKQNSTNSPNSPKSPQSPGSPSQPYFKFTDPALQSSALTIKERLLQWCRDKTRDYENVKLENFSTSWADGLAFCALVHHFLPDAFDYSKLTPERRRHNFTLAFKVADEKAGIYPLLDVDDMVAMRKPDWKCVFTYVQAIYRRFKDEQ